MATTLLLDRSAWDLVVDAAGNIAMATEPYAIEQDVASAVRLFDGELFYDTAKGIPYFEQVLGHAPPLPLFKSLIESAALTVPLVATARCYVTSLENRKLVGQIQVATTDGTALAINTTLGTP